MYYLFIYLFIYLFTSTSDLQTSTAIVNKLPDQLVSAQIRTMGVAKTVLNSSLH